MSLARYMAWERGTAVPRATKLRTLRRVLGVGLDEWDSFEVVR